MEALDYKRQALVISVSLKVRITYFSINVKAFIAFFLGQIFPTIRLRNKYDY